MLTSKTNSPVFWYLIFYNFERKIYENENDVKAKNLYPYIVIVSHHLSPVLTFWVKKRVFALKNEFFK